MRWLWSTLRARARGVLIAEALLLGATALSLGSTWLVGRAVDRHVPARDEAGLAAAAAGYVAAVLGGAALTWLARVRIEREAQAALVAVKERLFAHLVEHDLALHDREGSGRLLSRVTSDVDALRLLFSEVLLTAPADLVLFAGMLGILAVQAPPLAAVAAGSLPLFAALLYGYRRVSPRRFLAAREQAAAVSGFVAEHLRALPLVRSYGRVEWLRARGRAGSAAKYTADLGAGMAGVWFFNLLFGVRTMMLAAMVWVGAEAVAAGTLTLGVLLVGLDYARKMVDPFVRLQFHLSTIERARAGAVRVDDLLRAEPEVRAPADPAPWPGLGRGLTVEGVRFAYPGGRAALDGVDLAVGPGERVGVVGPTGGGKSTLLQLLFRFRDPGAGRVCVDGVDIRTLDPAELRRRIGLVHQAVHLLPGTVAENLGCSPARAAALLVDLGLDRRLAPDTRVGDGGEPLSRGEAQLLCVGRALAGEPPILVLDEATAAMDPATEARVRALLAARPDRAVVWVAHRLRTVEGCDRIVVIEAGRVVETGDHASLLAQGGRYAALWRASLAAEGTAA